jgi:hypothetical protein
MKKSFLFFLMLLSFSIPNFLQAQNINDLFKKPLEENPEPWLMKMHHDDKKFYPPLTILIFQAIPLHKMNLQ